MTMRHPILILQYIHYEYTDYNIESILLKYGTTLIASRFLCNKLHILTNSIRKILLYRPKVAPELVSCKTKLNTDFHTNDASRD